VGTHLLSPDGIEPGASGGFLVSACRGLFCRLAVVPVSKLDALLKCRHPKLPTSEAKHIRLDGFHVRCAPDESKTMLVHPAMTRIHA
jgi:hypothetical protein